MDTQRNVPKTGKAFIADPVLDYRAELCISSWKQDSRQFHRSGRFNSPTAGSDRDPGCHS